jgi:hypothetical protein
MMRHGAGREGASPSGGAVGGAPDGASLGARGAPASEGASPSERRTGEVEGIDSC